METNRLTLWLNPSLMELKNEGEHLRFRSGALRDTSRDLRQRANACRERARVLCIPEGRRAPASPATEDPVERIERLLKAEADLEKAIADCTTAIREVRRELRWEDTALAPSVH